MLHSLRVRYVRPALRSWAITSTLLVLITAFAPPVLGADLSFDQARSTLLAKSDRLKAAEANLNRQELEAKAAETLGYPELILNATQLFGIKTFDLSALPIGVSAYNYNFDGPRSSLLLNWPIYTGGKITAAQRFREAEVSGAKAELHETEERLDLTLIARYFGLRLAGIVEGLRKAQLEQSERQLGRARRFEAQGQISAVERLSAQVSRDEVARDVVKASRERESAEASLVRMLRQTGAVQPTTPLFVVTSPIEPLTVWLREAEIKNPTLALIKSKGTAAEQGIAVAKSEYMPQVFAFGQYNFVKYYLTPIEPDWIAGITSISSYSAARIAPARSAPRRHRRRRSMRLKPRRSTASRPRSKHRGCAWHRRASSFACSTPRWNWPARICACASVRSRKGNPWRSMSTKHATA